MATDNRAYRIDGVTLLDGTLDTVLTCRICGRDERYTFAAWADDADTEDANDYDAFVEWALEDAAMVHECELALV